MKELFKNHNPRNKPFDVFLTDNYNENEGGIFVDIGCGSTKINPDFIGIDPYAKHDGVDILAHMWDIPLEDNSVDLLLCFHALEHVSKYQVFPTLKEFARILKPEAAFGIVVPNLYWVMLEWVKNPNTGFEMDMIFGTQTHPGEFHQTGYTAEILKDYFDLVPELKIINIYDIEGWSQMNFGVIGRKI